MDAQALLTGTLLLLGAGFLVANVRLLLDYIRFRKRRPGALLVWPAPPPPNQRVVAGLAFVLGLLVCFKLLVVGRQAFGETMMFLYYAYMQPLSRRIGRGFYGDGIQADTEFIPYGKIDGISWREGEHRSTLVVITRLHTLARRLTVPGDQYGEARRILRDKIAAGAVRFAGSGLNLGGHDGRDTV